MFSPDLAASRAAAVPVMEQEIRHPLASTGLLNEAGTRLECIGFDQQVVKGESEANFFLVVNGRRRTVLYEQDRFVLPEAGEGSARLRRANGASARLGRTDE